MMLLEDQGKRILRDHGARVPSGRTVTAAEEVGDLPPQIVVKALVPAGGRGKSGGVRRLSGDEEARTAVAALLGATISGHIVGSVLIEEALSIAREMYLSIIIDRSLGIPVIMASGAGGMDVESLDESSLRRWPLHPFVGVRQYMVRELTETLELRGREGEVGEFLEILWEVFVSLDCEVVEINPLVLTADGALVAADAKIVINDDSLFRHPEIPLPPVSGDGLERAAKAEGMAFVRLDGDIGVIANGAGLTMATLDALSAHGKRSGAFMDLGGTDDPAKVRRAFELMVLSGQKVIFVNIFGGMTKCDTVARGILDALEGLTSPPATVVRLRGINEDGARKMLRSGGITSHAELESAVAEAAALGASGR
jgi:succinyl-CoA synthetase beta subunit